MEALIIFGGIMLLMGLIARQGIQWDIDPNACNMDVEKRMVRTNRITYYVLVYGGTLLMAIGGLGMLFL